MNISSLIGTKLDQTQGFLEDGTRVPLSLISLAGNNVTQIKNAEKEGYNSVQIGLGIRKKPKKAIAGIAKKAGLDKTPRFFREVRLEDTEGVALGSTLSPAEVFKPGDVVDIVGTSKGKGYAGVVKRYHFKGGPRTHGQSDRERAPGSIGQTTTPGRVYKGKRMAGRMGDERVTIKNLQVLDLEGNTLFVKGLVPGIKGGLVMITRVGKNKKFTPLYKKENVQKVEEVEVTPEEMEKLKEQIEAPKNDLPAEATESLKVSESSNNSSDIVTEEVQSRVEASEIKEEQNANK
ncbi:MAG: 50S ribosomal protein L3 [Candidatus Levybacteria bacterium CG_4_10_14_0_2_um_filter_36_16]|nr:MAG: 50S ribosomal protein L3 [Candidatus Levybacteria bacterium CG2_30_37_29]PIR79289.1 MAG: 50S ribosomal protein L3 [Candidatus Levybacteria bacterium CG10_big_fil_rev_8_21_14_0_10_36_30]PIZ97132.1 MAG: 50S ribosomal protein L3 [Candidatus Levybacteria bacterium CG_4_10_14_0_2_um_filter_36_16]PJA90197.1 MAG: 50S ribosomal protein L3 [Candidatus Levybacteria bacterium CG_4_9_14_3_um_filter_36_7]